MDITLVDQTAKVSAEQQAEITTLLTFAGAQLDLPKETEMSVTFMTNDEIQTINRTYRGIDRPTDVISFANEELGEEELPVVLSEDFDLPRNLGDILISIERAAEQAVEYGHSYERELGFLVVHGFLHLNGYDHQTPEDEEQMFTLQRKILSDYGLTR